MTHKNLSVEVPVQYDT